MVYDYDAGGNKHKYVADTLTVKYAGIFEYRQVGSANNLARVATSEGQLVPSGDTLRFDYFVKDHLGNVRVVWDESGKVIQSTDYYPFGLEIDRSSPIQTPAARNAVNRYLYNGKELQVGTGLVDYGARMYMPEIGRMGRVDGAADLFEDYSPYSYGLNNPLVYVDPSGDTTIHVNNLPANWQAFNPQTDDVQLDQVTVSQSRERGQSYIGGFSTGGMGGSGDVSKSPNVQYALARNDRTPGQYIPGNDGIQSDFTLELFAIPVAKPILWAASAIRAAWLARIAGKGGSKYLYHYTSREAAEAISQQGLKVGKDGFSYLTNKGALSPLQAQIELALPANRALPNSILRIDASGLNPALIRRVSGNLPGYGAGGGTEFLFNQHIPANLIKVIK